MNKWCWLTSTTDSPTWSPSWPSRSSKTTGPGPPPITYWPGPHSLRLSLQPLELKEDLHPSLINLRDTKWTNLFPLIILHRTRERLHPSGLYLHLERIVWNQVIKVMVTVIKVMVTVIKVMVIATDLLFESYFIAGNGNVFRGPWSSIKVKPVPESLDVNIKNMLLEYGVLVFF